MNMDPKPLSDKSRAILEAIAQGRTYEQILVQELAWTYHDIFQAAAEALAVAGGAVPGKGYEERMSEIRQTHPKAYQPWTSEEDARLTEHFRAGAAIPVLAQTFQRQPSAIRSRLAKLNLLTPSA